MKIGITGHQERVGADWIWASTALTEFLCNYEEIEGWSSLAGGADQLFANAVLKASGTLVTVIPIDNYESFFKTARSRREYLRLLDRSKAVLAIQDTCAPNEAFYRAGRMIVERCEIMVAIWDELPSVGLGGTADIVTYARQLGKRIFVLNPIGRLSIWQ